MKYKSKKDSWIGTVVLFAVGTMVAATISVWVGVNGMADLFTAVGFTLLTFLLGIFVGWTWYGTFYKLHEQELYIRSGPFRWRIPYTEITKVRETRNPLSGPALSLDRLAIRRRRKAIPILISPLNKTEFLQELSARIPGLPVKRFPH